MTTNANVSGTHQDAPRVAVVTGATSGIGTATALRLAADGARVALLGRREDRLKDLAARIGPAALPVAVDVTDGDALDAAAATIRSAFGPVDLVVANAGVMLPAAFERADTAEWDQMIDTNLRGLLRTARMFMDDLLAAASAGARADLVLVGSVGGHMVFPTYAVYTATKAAVAHLTRTLRAELGPRGVRVKNVEPGFVGTELGEATTDPAARQQLDEWRAGLEMLVPEDIADAIGYAVNVPTRVNVAELIVVPTPQG